MQDERATKQRQTQQLTIQLERNSLICRPLAQGPRSLFRAISDYLYFNPNYSDELVQLCRSTLDRCLLQNSLPSKLAYLVEKPSYVSDYKQNPHLHGYQKIHLELLCVAYERRIRIYSMSDDYYLNCLVIGDRSYRKEILLSRVGSHFTAIILSQIRNIADMLKELIYQKLTAEESQQVNSFTRNHRHHKKSMSACDEQQYKPIFDNAKEFICNTRQKPPLRKMYSLEEDDDDLNLIKECSTDLPKRPNHMKDMYGFRFPDYGLRIDTRFVGDRLMTYASPSQPLLPAPPTPTLQSQRSRTKPVVDQAKQLESNKRYTGRLKFFDENKNYGFIVMDQDSTDIFVHYDDLHKAGMTKQFMRTTKQGNIIRFSFLCMIYIGKYDKSRKAVDLVAENEEYMHV